MRYFQNARSRRDNNLQVVLAHKRKGTAAVPLGVSKQQTVSQSLFGILNYLPGRPDGETDDTILDMINMMKDESRRLKQNPSRIEDLMTQTFADRRRSIVTDNVAIADLKEQYPCLFTHEQVCQCSIVCGYT